MQKRNFVLRTIRDGQVKINGWIFRPSAKWLEYDGRLDGQRWAFGLYWTGGRLEQFVELWGTAEAYYAARDNKLWDEYCEAHPQPIDTVYSTELQNWYYPWATWYAEDWVRLQGLTKGKNNG